eukprot:11856448-Ditylum_brightwellii.AAC.1
MVSTDMSCNDAKNSQEALFTKFLTSKPSFAMDDNSICMVLGDSVIIFYDVGRLENADSNRALRRRN